MSTFNKSTHACCRGGCAGVQLVALLVLPLLGTAVAADDAGAWRLEPALAISTATYFDYSAGTSTAYPAVGAELSIELSSPQRPFASGLFANYGLTTSAEGKYAQLVGSWVRYRYGRWKLSTVAAHLKSGHVSGRWVHASRLQFEPRPGHKFAIEAIGVIGSGGDPALQLAYSTNLTGRTSLSINIGLGSNRIRDFGASTKFVWNLF